MSTREHWISTADRLLEAAWRWATPDSALLDLPGRPSKSGVQSDGLEGYARTFLAAAFRAAGTQEDRWLDRYAEGLQAGAAGAWPKIQGHDVFGQPMVESASVALGLRLTRPWLWDKLDDSTQDQAEAWLRDALTNVPAPNNWYLFPFTVAGFLEDVGRGDEVTNRARERALDLLESWYRGQGWYSDGDGRAFDHYNGWALHLYPVLDAYLGNKETPHGQRLKEHLESFSLLFGSDGAPIHFGRSLTYRFAAASAVALGAVTGHTPLSPGQSQGLINRSLDYFLNNNSLTDDGLLSLGWHGPHEPTLQNYSGPASPYWASKAFVCLLAQEDHPLWTAQEESIEEKTLAVPAPGFLIQVADGIARLHNHGSDHIKPHEGEFAADDDPHYGRLAYSTKTGPTAKTNVADNHFAVVINGNRSVRRRIHPIHAADNWAASWHRPAFPSGPPMFPGLKVESITIAHGRYELRVHRVHKAPHGTRVEETGWATELHSQLVPVHGWTGKDEVRAPQGTAYTPWVTIPRLTAEVEGTAIFAALAVLSEEREQLPETGTIITGNSLEVHWFNTTTRITFGEEGIEVV
ncbi:DUF2264 domain-containing protein [Kibdelosporangium philippinense]|uniref:DUF2264 domain-containing protein n=1 Tax=Kibdelosporangium philippinense TaxID=211113 RepID=A0ABS8Z7V3_9PSEU|nr:DUF2264 domain-containing protein [Kibdelosporangium philippinense]MCE7002875.1 DUF2264 domain-containing protein [Kibdelosporangium philippinense]